jgi:catecholate siderophore receptor
MSNKNRSSHRFRAAANITLFSVSYLALAAASANEAYAQASPPAQAEPESPSTPVAPAQEPSSPQTAPSSPPAETPAQQPANSDALPPVNVEAANPKPRSTSPLRSAQVSAPRPIAPPPSAPDPSAAVQAAWPASGTQDARTGTVGVFSNSTSVATKINTPIVNIPQSLSVVTREFIADNAFQNLTDVTRYVPGVAIHQGEGNRDELVIRGVDSSANFFVNGFRDDVQYFRDLYNAQSVEILKGPSAITFGRGAGGGVLNRTLKEADGQRIYEATAQTGSYYDARFTLDAGQAVNENVATRLNAMYEKSDTFRQYGWLERWGINPTATFKLGEFTKVRVSYENFHDARTADRGNPSLGLSPVPPPSTRFNPAGPFAPNGDLTAFFGSPNLN